MPNQPEMQTIPAAKLFFKLTIIGSFLLGVSYACLVLLNTALHALK